MIVVLNGKAGAGKDTAANHLVSQYSFVKINFADPLRQVCKIVFGLTDAEMSDRVLKETTLDRYPHLTPRKIMQLVGTEAFRKNFEGVWVDAFLRAARRHPRVVVADCRFPDEGDAVHAQGGTIIRVLAIGSPFETPETGHASEAAVNEVRIDHEVTNDFTIDSGVEVLKYQMDLIMHGLGLRRRSNPVCSGDYLPPAIRD